MTVVKNVLNRIHVQRLLLAAALFGLSLSAHAKGLPGLTATSAGKSTVIKVASDGTPLATKAPSVLTPGGGWTGAGNYGVAQGASGAVKVGAEAIVNVAGNAVPVSVVGQVVKDAVIGGVIGCATGGAVGCALGVATPLALGYMSMSGTRVSPTVPGQLEMLEPQACYYDCLWYRFHNQRFPSVDAACAAYQASVQPAYPDYTITSTAGPAPVPTPEVPSPPFTCRVRKVYNLTGAVEFDADIAVGITPDGARPPDSPTWYPATPQQVKDALYKNNPDPLIVPELDKAGADAKALPITDIAVSGPAAIAGPSTTTINNIDNSTTTTQTTNNYTYNGNSVTNGGQTTKTETTKADGTKTASTTTTVSPGDAQPAKPEEPKVQCDKYPNSLGCAELDTPDAEIPKDTKTVNFTAEDPFGGGRCPADVMASFRAIGGQSLKIVDWSTFCDMALPLRGLVMALASIMAFFIIMPGGVRE